MIRKNFFRKFSRNFILMLSSFLKRKKAYTFLILLVLATTPSNGFEREKFSPNLPLIREVSLPLPEVFPYPEKIFAVNSPILNADSAIAVDADSGVILFEKNSDKKAFPASTTKLMTALVALERYKPSDTLVVKIGAVEGNLSGLVPGEKISVSNLIYAALVPSGNDAAYALANGEGDLEQFIDAMNKKAEMLSMTNTHFTNPAGLHNTNHYSTARDLAELGKVALQDPLITKVVGTPETVISNQERTLWHELKTTNQLLGLEGIDGIKTGFTEEALGALIVSSKKNGRNIITVVLRSEDRFTDTLNLLNYVFGAYRW